MTLADAIRANRSRYMERLRSDQALAWVASACISSERLALYVEAQGWQTEDEALAACARINGTFDTVAHARIANPRPSFTAPGRRVEFVYLHRLIDTAINGDPALPIKLKPGYAVRQSDRWHSRATVDQLRELASICPAKQDDYAWELRDCDDQNKLARAWLVLNGFGNLAAFEFDYVAYKGDEVLGGHTVLICPDAQDHIWLWDVLSGRIEPLTCTTLGGFSNATRLEGVGLYS